MAEYSNLSATINAQIRANGVQAITGPVLNAVLTAMVNVLGDGYRLAGVAHPADNPGSPDNRVAYLAAQDGTYTKFGGLTISGEVALLLWDSAWTKETLFSIDAAVTPGSDNLITSGAVDSALAALATQYMALVPTAAEGNLAEFDNAGQVRDAGIATTDLATKDGHYPDLFAGFAGNLVDTRSAGTRQGPFAFRQSGGDGVNYMRRILGRTEAWNQLVGPSDTQVTIPSGHLYYAIINGTASVGTSDGTPISVTGGTDIVVDLTLLGLGDLTAAQFEALHPLPYYNYNAGVLKNNAATRLETTGFNQWDEQWEPGGIRGDNGQNASGFDSTRIRSKNYCPCLPNRAYNTNYVGHTYTSSYPRLFWYDADKNYVGTSVAEGVNTSPANAYYFRMNTEGASYGNVYNHDICINLSDASRNGIYEPYWKRDIVLGLDNLACHDENNNAVVVNGLDGVGTSQDELIVENGWGKKINKKMEEVDMGDLDWSYSATYLSFYVQVSKLPAGFNKALLNTKAINSKFATLASSGIDPLTIPDKTMQPYNAYLDQYLVIKESAYTDAATFKAAMSGVKLRFEVATPKVLTLDNPIPALIEVDNLGTEKRLPEDTADNPQGPFECDSNYSVSTANLVRLLNL